MADFPISPSKPTSMVSFAPLFTYNQAMADRIGSNFAQEYCTVTQCGELVCAGKRGNFEYVNFAKLDGNPALYAATASSLSANLVPVSLGVFFGDKCVDGSSM